MKKKILLLFILIGAVFIFTIPSHALLITHNLNFEYSNGAPPKGDPPWLTAEFDDGGTAGSVTLTMDASGLSDAEFVTKWLFNVNNDLLLGSGILSFTPQLSETTGPLPSSLGVASNAYDLTPARGFDIEFIFPNSNGQQDRFEAGEEVVFLIEDTGNSITADTFSALNSSDKGPLFTTVAHVQGIVSDLGDSGKIAATVPESSTLLLVGVGLIGLAGFGRRRIKS